MLGDRKTSNKLTTYVYVLGLCLFENKVFHLSLRRAQQEDEGALVTAVGWGNH